MSLPALYNTQIDSYYKYNKHYGGCFSKDEFPTRARSGKFYILNLDHPEGQGTHYVMVFLLKRNYGIYFDSFGLDPPSDIDETMKKLKKENYRNIGQTQDIKSSACGWYCIYIIDHLLQGESYIDILNRFDTHLYTSVSPTKNERILIDYFKNKKDRF